MLKNKIVSLFILIIMLSSFLPTKAAETNINISPVVQVISYYDIYGKYPMMM
jgi:hypothetical protein